MATAKRVREVSFSSNHDGQQHPSGRGPRPAYGRQLSQSCHVVGASSAEDGETSDDDDTSNCSLPADTPRPRLYRVREQSNMSIGRSADNPRRPLRFRPRIVSRTTERRTSNTVQGPTSNGVISGSRSRNSTSLHALDASSRTLVENWEEYDFITLCCHLKPWGKAIVVFDIFRAFSTIATAFFVLQDIANECAKQAATLAMGRSSRTRHTRTSTQIPSTKIPADLTVTTTSVNQTPLNFLQTLEDTTNLVFTQTTVPPEEHVTSICMGLPEWLLAIAAGIATISLVTALLASLAIFRGYKPSLAAPHCVTSVFLLIFFVVSPTVLLLKPPRADRKQIKALISSILFACALLQLVIIYLLLHLLHYLRLKRHYFKALKVADWDFSRMEQERS